MSTALKPELKSTTIEVALFEAWNAVGLLALLNNPALATFSDWLDGKLVSLEADWQHASPPRSKKGTTSFRPDSSIAARRS